MKRPHVPLSLISLVCLMSPLTLQGQLGLVPLQLHTPKAPVPVLAEGELRLAYEIWVTNMGTAPRRVVELSASSDAGTPLLNWRSDSLRAAWRTISRGDSALTVGAGGTALVYLWVTLPRSEPVPSVVHHRMLVEVADSTRDARPDTLDGYEVSTVLDAPATFGRPFADGPWLAANGPGNTSGHRRTAIPIGGRARIAQRFAIDWVKLGADGRLFQGDSTVNANWYGYGTPLLAVQDGVVTDAKDGIPENVPLSPERAVPVTLETIGGNYVILDVGGGAYAFYAHLQPGSLRVGVGDRVERGQIIGLLGNSGNSDAPHLHLHVGDANAPLGAEGIPFTFDEFELLGHVEALDLGGTWRPSSASSTERASMPLENAVIRFPRR